MRFVAHETGHTWRPVDGVFSAFSGNEPSADTTEKAPAGVKGKKAAKPAAVLDGPKSPKVLELEAKVAEQGQVSESAGSQDIRASGIDQGCC